MTSPASLLLRLTPNTWTHSENKGLKAYNYIPSRRSQLILFQAFGYNVFKTLEKIFVSIPLCCGLKKSAVNWTYAKIYWELTVICLKALWDSQVHMSPLYLMEAYSNLHSLMNWEGADINLEARGTRSCSSDFLMRQAFDKLLPNQQLEFMIYLKAKLYTQPIEYYAAKNLYSLALFLISVYNQEEPCDQALQPLFSELLSSCTKGLQIQGWIIVKTRKIVKYPDHFVLDHILFTENNEGVRFLNPTFDADILPILSDSIMIHDLNYWTTHEDKGWAKIDLLIQLTQCKEDAQVYAYLNAACNYWAKKLLEPSLLRVKLSNLEILAKACEHAELMNATTTMRSYCDSIANHILSGAALDDASHNEASLLKVSEIINNAKKLTMVK